MRGRWMVALGLVVGLAGCGGNSTGPGKWSDPTTITYYSGLHVDLSRMSKTASGVFYYDSIHGTGATQVKPGDQVTVHYTLWLPDGTQIETNSGLGVTLTSSNVIQGWIDGLSGAVVGTTRQLVIPPTLAYGETGSGKIPGNTTIVFLVTIDRLTPASSGDMVPVQRIADALLESGAASRFR